MDNNPTPGKPLATVPLVRAISTDMATARAAMRNFTDHVCFENRRFYTVNHAMFIFRKNNSKVTFAEWSKR